MVAGLFVFHYIVCPQNNCLSSIFEQVSNHDNLHWENFSGLEEFQRKCTPVFFYLFLCDEKQQLAPSMWKAAFAKIWSY